MVKEKFSDRFVADAKIEIVKNQTTILKGATNTLGYARLCLDTLKLSKKNNNIQDYTLRWTGIFNRDGQVLPVTKEIPLNPYLHTYNLYLENELLRNDFQPKKLDTVADMHYHVSMRTHNLFGEHLYNGAPHAVPTNLNWYRDYHRLRVLAGSRWRKPYLGPSKPRLVSEMKKERMSALLNQKFIRSRGGSIKLTHQTQATHPHILEGNVYLAFNAFSPFEHSVSNTPQKIFANRNFVTGAPRAWLKRIGWKDNPMTHWENFNLEYKMITAQSQSANLFPWRFFDEHVNLFDPLPTIVNVVEGSHTLQDKLFPHYVNFNLGARTRAQSEFLLENILNGLFPGVGQNARKLNFIADHIQYDTLQIRHRRFEDLLQSNASIDNIMSHLVKTSLDSLIDFLLKKELSDNIYSLKQLPYRIPMMTIAHLTYNGMMGHAPSLDGGKFPNNLVARKNYSIRVSDDRKLNRQWESTFFSIPGVNTFGKHVIHELIKSDPAHGHHRIYIDLKHSDYFTRHFFYDSIMVDTVGECMYDTIPPICSHCGVTGLPGEYYSPFVNEYNITDAGFTRIFYPFGINLYNEEISIICRNNGIIGIPLEQRILGGYLNKKQIRNYSLNKKGVLRSKYNSKGKVRTQLINRYHNLWRIFRHYFKEHDDSLFLSLKYTRDIMGVKVKPDSDKFKHWRKAVKITYGDYISAEPFLQNLFYIIDHSGKEKKDAWQHVCIGSDLDGLIDPIDICPTASQYPFFKERLRQFIPLFLAIRGTWNGESEYYKDKHYFDDTFTKDDALDQLFYASLRDFTAKYFLKDLKS